MSKLKFLIIDVTSTYSSCWLSTDKGTIWAFTGPVLFFITVSVSCLLYLQILYTMYMFTASSICMTSGYRNKAVYSRLIIMDTVNNIILLYFCMY